MEPWLHISEVTKNVGKYIDDRRKGLVKSLKTGFYKLDAANIGGFEWKTTVTIGGRPSVGKSAFSECLIQGFIKNNDDDFDVLDFTWEMDPEVIIKRNLSSDHKRSYKYICSAQNNTITEEEMQDFNRSLELYNSRPIFYVPKPSTVQEFADIVRKFRDKRKRKLVVRVDHTILAKISREDGGDRVTMLLNLLGKANELKKEDDTIFMFLTQMKREFEARQENDSDKAFPMQGDVFGGDATAMYSETMILLNRPAMYKIGYYGKRPNGVMVDRHDLFAHIVKARNSEPGLVIKYTEDFQNMSIYER